MKTHIAIATTNGLVMVQQLDKEDPGVQSVVCLGGTLGKRLSVSSSYVDFIERGTGLIAKEFGHDAWRLDISANIDTGDSWQLPVYLAHYYYEKGELGHGEPVSGDQVIIATGALGGLTDKRQIKAVEHVAAKQRSAAEVIQRWQAQDIQCQWHLHPDNAAQLDTDLPIKTLLTLDDLDASNTVANAASPVANDADGKDLQQSTSVKSSSSRAGLMVIALIVLLGITGFYWLNQDDKQFLDDFGGYAKELPADPISVLDRTPIVQEMNATQLFAAYSVESRDCETAENRAALSLSSTSAFSTLSVDRLCSLRFKSKDSVLQVWLVSLNNGATVELAYQNAELGWMIPLPENRQVDQPYGLVLVTELDQTAVNDVLDSIDAIDWRTRGNPRSALEQTVAKRMGESARVVFHRLESAEWNW